MDSTTKNEIFMKRKGHSNQFHLLSPLHVIEGLDHLNAENPTDVNR